MKEKYNISIELICDTIDSIIDKQVGKGIDSVEIINEHITLISGYTELKRNMKAKFLKNGSDEIEYLNDSLRKNISLFLKLLDHKKEVKCK